MGASTVVLSQERSAIVAEPTRGRPTLASRFAFDAFFPESPRVGSKLNCHQPTDPRQQKPSKRVNSVENSRSESDIERKRPNSLGRLDGNKRHRRFDRPDLVNRSRSFNVDGIQNRTFVSLRRSNREKHSLKCTFGRRILGWTQVIAWPVFRISRRRGENFFSFLAQYRAVPSVRTTE